MKLDARKAGIILNEMERKAAAMLTGVMASAAREDGPVMIRACVSPRLGLARFAGCGTGLQGDRP